MGISVPDLKLGDKVISTDGTVGKIKVIMENSNEPNVYTIRTKKGIEHDYWAFELRRAKGNGR